MCSRLSSSQQGCRATTCFSTSGTEAGRRYSYRCIPMRPSLDGSLCVSIVCIGGLERFSLSLLCVVSLQHLPAKWLWRMEQCSVALLMGCSSGKLRKRGEFEPMGVMSAYLIAGRASPSPSTPSPACAWSCCPYMTLLSGAVGDDTWHLQAALQPS